MAQGKPVSVTTSRPYGCSIKYWRIGGRPSPPGPAGADDIQRGLA